MIIIFYYIFYNRIMIMIIIIIMIFLHDSLNFAKDDVKYFCGRILAFFSFFFYFSYLLCMKHNHYFNTR